MDTKGRILLLVSCILHVFVIPCYCNNDTLLQGQPLRDWEHLVSENNIFRLQFFSPGRSRSRYLGLFHNPFSGRAVWVGNRNNPIADGSGSLMVDTDSKLKLFHHGSMGAIIFDSVPTSLNSSATLLDNGNLVLREVDSDGSIKRVLWQSFDYPTDTFLPGMKLGVDLKTGHEWSLTSWRSDEVPAPGSFTLAADVNGLGQLVILWRNNITWSSGPWQNGRFKNAPNLSNFEKARNFTLVSKETERYFSYSVTKKYVPAYYIIDEYGILEEGEGVGAPFGVCFLATTPDPGCVQYERPRCSKPNNFFEKRQGLIMGDTYKFDESYNFTLFDCQRLCWNNCSCAGYAPTSENRTGCEIFFKRKDFFAEYDSSLTREVYILVPERGRWWIWLIVGVGSSLGLLLCSLCYILKRKFHMRGKNKTNHETETLLNELAFSNKAHSYHRNKKISHELQLLSFESISDATDNFSSTNRLGQGGFGPVYKGILLDGQEVAIKRLSRSSGQGIEEFKNEILLISKLQHNNLVRLLGCCIEVEEKALVYEYMPNKSLDFYLFDLQKKELLKWAERFNIIEGIAQGLLYLHKYSRLRVIHRDLKASNILIDNYLNPKISDFGMAKIFGINDSEANTNRVVGTYGYMSPEYAMNGVVSVKTDVFSYGVLLLEIVSGKKNNKFYDLERPLSLIGLAWQLWKEGKPLDLMDPTLEDSCSPVEVLRCIHVGLLCVQDHAADRPFMSDVVSMFTKENTNLPTPQQPAFFIDRHDTDTETNGNLRNISNSNLSISEVEAR